MTLTYGSYLKIDALLDLQEPASSPAEHDEMLFIIIHQVYELWFKQLLHELDRIKTLFSADDVFGSIHAFKRCRTIMKTLVGQLDILETMTPMSFTSFRDRLDTASGFQSAQFREFEFVLGYKRQDTLEYHDVDGPYYATMQRRLTERTVVDHFYDLLEQHDVTIPGEIRNREATEPNVANGTVQDGIERLYRNDPGMTILFESMTDFDEGLQEWRYRHVKMVERTIGSKQGSGGSLGVAFLKKSLFMSVFPDLWAIRHRL